MANFIHKNFSVWASHAVIQLCADLHLCVFEKTLLDALLQLSGSLGVTAHGDDDLDGVVVVQAGRRGRRTCVVHQNHLDLIGTVCLLHAIGLRQSDGYFV